MYIHPKSSGESFFEQPVTCSRSCTTERKWTGWDLNPRPQPAHSILAPSAVSKMKLFKSTPLQTSNHSSFQRC
jgi:hypothetical protein